jgi:uncharacterized protein
MAKMMQTTGPSRDQPAESALPFAPDLFDLLICPEARCPLKFVGGRLVSTDGTTRRVYRIDDGIPIMLIDESMVLSRQEWDVAMRAAGPTGGGVAAVTARREATPG